MNLKTYNGEIQSDVMNSVCNGYCGRLCLGANYTECGACPWGWMMNHTDYYLVQPDYYLVQPQICYPCENTFDSYDWLFIIFNFGMLYMLHAQAILRFSGTWLRTSRILKFTFSSHGEIKSFGRISRLFY